MATRTKKAISFSIFHNGKATKVAEISLAKNQPDFERLAMEWRYRISQRSRWSTNIEFLSRVERLARETIRTLGLKDVSQLKLLGNPYSGDPDLEYLHSLIEVSIPWTSESGFWWARVMPWEFLISAATKSYRGGQKKTVVRRLLIPGETRSRKPAVLRRFAVVEASPGVFRQHYDFTEERELVRQALGTLEEKNPHSKFGADPGLQQLKSWVKKERPDLIHFTGIDGRLGAELLSRPVPEKDGLYLSDQNRGLAFIDSGTLARSLFSDSYQPQLTSFNLWHSGARMAPLAVAHGSRAAIGFDDTFDDNVAERFFAQFYRHYGLSSWSLGKAFHEAFRAISPLSKKTRGSGIVLWTRESLLAVPSDSQKKGMASKGKTGVPANPDRHRARDLVSVQAIPKSRLNYADLHNGGSLFEKLRLAFIREAESEEKAIDGDYERIIAVKDVDVEVTLSAGGEEFPYRTTLDLTLDDDVVDIADKQLAGTANHGNGGIHVPLTSGLMRSVDECILASVHVVIRWHSQVVFNQTSPVQLAPVDEWQFEDNQIIWMSSFIHPRDRAVTQIVDSAQRYLACLADDCNAGFSGYQAYDPDAENPWRGVDLQVQALWTALALDYGLSYINPPPSYSENAQRLRTPSAIIEQRRGTCVDLALLMAACLEWVEIYPVIFNLQDHAFPGYWRNPEAYEKFQSSTGALDQPQEISEFAGSGQQYGWYSVDSAYKEIREYVIPARRQRDSDSKYESRSDLIPMETVFLTQRAGFSSAVAEGRGYFSALTSSDFHSMIDVVRSRSRVTPIPFSTIHSKGGAISGD
jgi:hypothetical protein